MRLSRQLSSFLVLSLCFAAAAACAQSPWPAGVSLGDSRDNVRIALDRDNLPAGSTPDGSLQTNSDYPVSLPGLRYPIPMMLTFAFDTNSRLAEMTLSLDLPAMRRDWAAVGSDEALYNFAADKLAFALAANHGAPIFSSPSCNSATDAPCTIQWREINRLTIQLERIPNGHHLRIHYLPPGGIL
ncbi:MAG: hypothetical protein WB439_05525 [Acidobacteriaceae bacterium]